MKHNMLWFNEVCIKMLKIITQPMGIKCNMLDIRWIKKTISTIIEKYLSENDL